MCVYLYIVLVQTKGIIYRSIKYSETSLILDIYTEKLGMRSCIISGIRSKKAKTKSGILQVMSLVDVLLYNKQNDSLCRIKEVKADRLYASLPFHMIKRSIGIFITEVGKKCFPEKEENQDLYSFLKNTYLHLDTSNENTTSLHYYFLIELAYILGFGPSVENIESGTFFNLQEGTFQNQFANARYCLDEQDTEDLKLLFLHTLLESKRLHLPNQRKVRLLQNLIKYYQYHIDNFGEIKSLPVLQQVLHS